MRDFRLVVTVWSLLSTRHSVYSAVVPQIPLTDETTSDSESLIAKLTTSSPSSTELEAIATEPGAHTSGNIIPFGPTSNNVVGVDVTLVGKPISWDNLACDITGEAPATDRKISGCIAEAVELLTYVTSSGKLVNGKSTNQNKKTHTGKLKDQSRHIELRSDDAKPQINYHSNWLPVSNCTTSVCRLLAQSRHNTWTAAGNITHKGNLHEFYFIQTGQVIGYKLSYNVVRDFLPLDKTAKSTLGQRRAGLNGHKSSEQTWDFEIEMFSRYTAYTIDYASSQDDSGTVATAIGDTVAKTNFHQMCAEMYLDGVNVGNSLFNIVTNDTTAEISSAQALKTLHDCSQPSETFVCYPDATSIDPSILQADSAAAVPRFSNGYSGVHGQQRWDGPESCTDSSAPYETYFVHDVFEESGLIPFITPGYPIRVESSTKRTIKHGDDSVYTLSNPGDCNDGSLQTDSEATRPSAIMMEHIDERLTGRNFLEFVQHPVMNLGDYQGDQFADISSVPFEVLVRWASVPYSQWGLLNVLPLDFPMDELPSQGSYFSDLADAYGSIAYPNTLAKLDPAINGYKARIYSTIDSPTTDILFDGLASNPSIQNTTRALTLLRLGFASFSYINTRHMKDIEGGSYAKANAASRRFDTLYARAHGGQSRQMQGLHTTFRHFLAQRIQNHHRNYMLNRLDQLDAAWAEVQKNPAVFMPELVATVHQARRLIRAVRTQVPTMIVYDRTRFMLA